MKNGPELWDVILAQFPGDAVIAGGAVRDYLLGVEPKDIDVFYKVPEPSAAETPVGDPFSLQNITEADDPRPRGLNRIDNQYERQEEYTALSNIALVSSGELLGYKVDAIELTEFNGDGLELVESFDFGITQAYYAGKGRIHTTNAFEIDFKNKTATLLRGDRLERAQKRFERFNERMKLAFTFVSEFE